MMNKIAITMGDTGGIGPEVIVKALADRSINEKCKSVVIGNPGVISDALRLTGIDLRIRSISDMSESEYDPRRIEVLNLESPGTAEKNRPSPEAGEASVRYIKKAVELALEKKVSAIVTAPISKESIKMAGYKWPGHTEMLAELTGTDSFAMMFSSERLKVILCTIHVSLREAIELIDKERVLKTIELARTGAGMLGLKDPAIAVAGLNPHAGENGLMGNEESTIISPAMEEALEKGMKVEGPFPPDVVFHRAYHGDFDIVVSMYHDQGLIPFKMLAFETGVNFTVGLPIIRTSPDHGTGFDIAWQNRANPSSMIEAIKLAASLEVIIQDT